jgi:hypothetical protein
VSQKTIGEIFASDPASTPLVGTELVELETAGGDTKGVKVADLRGGAIAVKSASYTILDVDADVFEFDDASVDGTFTLPTLADNFGRVIELHNVDDTYKATLDGEGAETMDGDASRVLPSQYNYLKVRAGTVGWHVLEMKANYDGGWVNQPDLTDLTQTVTHNLGVTIDQLLCKVTFATASDGTNAIEQAAGIYDSASPSTFNHGVCFVGSSLDAIVLQTGLSGINTIATNGTHSGDDGTEYDYYRVVIIRIK